LLARSEEGLIETQEELRQYGVPVMSISLDVADSQAVESAAIRLDNAPGPLSSWINSAMVTVFSPIDKLSAEDIQRVTEVTSLGTVHGTLAALQIDASAW
jgi:short-subunit dehydrogenase